MRRFLRRGDTVNAHPGIRMVREDGWVEKAWNGGWMGWSESLVCIFSTDVVHEHTAQYGLPITRFLAPSTLL